jgi:hypothetical protein
MRIAFFGDIVGRPGRRALAAGIERIRAEHPFDLILANVENAAGGVGVNEKVLRELESLGLAGMTSGNHIWDRKEGVPLLDRHDRLIRPANYPEPAPGRGWTCFEVEGVKVALINLQGRVYMPSTDCPFRTVDRILEELGEDCAVRIVDFHAEATSEKIAMGWYLDGRVSLVVGTHTHVPTADARVLPEGTGYVTDVGMCGSRDSVIGVEKGPVIERFRTIRPVRFDPAKGDLVSDVVIAEVDPATGTAEWIELRRIEVGRGDDSAGRQATESGDPEGDS